MRSSSGSSEDRGPQGSAVWEVGGGGSRTQRRSVRESAAAAIGAWKNTKPLYVQTRSREAGCLVRRGPRRCGRGEAAGDCVFAAEPFRTAAAERTCGTGCCRRRCSRHRPGSSGNTEQEAEIRECCGEGKGKTSSHGKVPRLNVGAEGLDERTSVSGGAVGTGGSYSWAKRSGGGTPPCRRGFSPSDHSA